MAWGMAAGTSSPPAEPLFPVAGPGDPLCWTGHPLRVPSFHLLVLLSGDALIIHPKDLFKAGFNAKF